MPEVPQYVSNLNKPQELQKLINEALYIIDKFGVPIEGISQRRMERMAMAFLAVANVKESSEWSRHFLAVTHFASLLQILRGKQKSGLPRHPIV